MPKTITKEQKQENIEEKVKVELDSQKIKNREKNIRIVKIAILVMILFLIIIYFLLRLFYEGGAFTVALDENLAKRSGLVMYERLSEKEQRKILKVDQLEFIDNISINWLPDNLDTEGEGTHNGENYMAYTFYVLLK